MRACSESAATLRQLEEERTALNDQLAALLARREAGGSGSGSGGDGSSGRGERGGDSREGDGGIGRSARTEGSGGEGASQCQRRASEGDGSDRRGKRTEGSGGGGSRGSGGGDGGEGASQCQRQASEEAEADADDESDPQGGGGKRQRRSCEHRDSGGGDGLVAASGGGGASASGGGAVQHAPLISLPPTDREAAKAVSQPPLSRSSGPQPNDHGEEAEPEDGGRGIRVDAGPEAGDAAESDAGPSEDRGSIEEAEPKGAESDAGPVVSVEAEPEDALEESRILSCLRRNAEARIQTTMACMEAVHFSSCRPITQIAKTWLLFYPRSLGVSNFIGTIAAAATAETMMAVGNEGH